jgi:glycosyltransferase involved in cell wall biosynthesis
LPWARRAEAEGYDVHVTALKTGSEDLVRREGFPFHPIAERDRDQNPLAELGVVVRLGQLLRRLDPDIAHFITLRSILYGASAARLVGVPAVLNSVTGLGFLFSDDSVTTRWLRWGVLQALRFALGHPNQRTSFHNPDNAALFASRGLVREDESVVTLGSGVDPERFPAVAETPVGDDGPLVLLPTRLLWHKGVGVFVEAARQLQSTGTEARFVIVGDTDPENPASVPNETVEKWNDAGIIEWWGYQAPEDMARVLQRAHVVCLPSYYREGVPKVLIEAASTGRPIVTTDVPGCREIVAHEENGFLVPPQDATALADRIRALLQDKSLREAMGRKGRRRVESRFTAKRVATSIVDAYNRLSGRPSTASSSPLSPADEKNAPAART